MHLDASSLVIMFLGRVSADVPDKSDFSWSNIGVSVLGAIASTAIFTVVSRGGLGGLLFAHLAPLPLMIIGLGFGVRHGATAALLATALLSVFPHPIIGMAYALLIATPACLACYAAAGAPRGGRDLIKQDIPSWAALAPAAVLSIVVIAWIIVATILHGSLSEALNPIRARAYIVIDSMIKDHEITGQFDPIALSGYVSKLMPAFLAGYGVLIHIINLWLAGRIAQFSGLLALPWPDIALSFNLPKTTGWTLIAGLAMSLFSGPFAEAGLILVVTMGFLFTCQGLAVTHARLRNARFSTLILTLIYFVLGVLGWPILLFAIIGLTDLVFNYRGVARNTNYSA